MAQPEVNNFKGTIELEPVPEPSPQENLSLEAEEPQKNNESANNSGEVETGEDGKGGEDSKVGEEGEAGEEGGEECEEGPVLCEEAREQLKWENLQGILLDALRGGNLEIIKAHVAKMKEDGHDPLKWRFPNWETPLHWAVQGKIEMVQYLLDLGFYLGAEDKKFTDPLCYASIREETGGAEVMIRFLLKSGADPSNTGHVNSKRADEMATFAHQERRRKDPRSEEEEDDGSGIAKILEDEYQRQKVPREKNKYIG